MEIFAYVCQMYHGIELLLMALKMTYKSSNSKNKWIHAQCYGMIPNTHERNELQKKKIEIIKI